jgi:hypothetical protein
MTIPEAASAVNSSSKSGDCSGLFRFSRDSTLQFLCLEDDARDGQLLQKPWHDMACLLE